MKWYQNASQFFILALSFLFGGGKWEGLITMRRSLDPKFLRPTVIKYTGKVSQKNPNLLEQETRSAMIIKKIAVGLLQSIGTTLNAELYCKGRKEQMLIYWAIIPWRVSGDFSFTLAVIVFPELLNGVISWNAQLSFIYFINFT